MFHLLVQLNKSWCVVTKDIFFLNSFKTQLFSESSGLYNKHMTIVKDDSSIIIKLSFKLIDAARGIIYDHHMFIVQATRLRTVLRRIILITLSQNLT